MRPRFSPASRSPPLPAGDRIVPAAAEHRPDVALRDIDLPGAGGPAAPANWPGAGLDAVGLTESMRRKSGPHVDPVAARSKHG
jgi:hypothetical protein